MTSPVFTLHLLLLLLSDAQVQAVVTHPTKQTESPIPTHLSVPSAPPIPAQDAAVEQCHCKLDGPKQQLHLLAATLLCCDGERMKGFKDIVI